MIAIINYDMGNLKSVAKALEHVGASVKITRDPALIRQADKLVLPGVGAFSKCMENLNHYGLTDVIREEIGKGKWFLGICLGLQLLFETSAEFGPSPGLGILKGSVKRFPTSPLKVPMIGWNQACQKRKALQLFKDIPDETYFYFVHSYFVSPQDKKVIATETEYGKPFCSSVEKDNILACQFHPEKSQKWGLKVLENFVRL